MLLTDQHQPSAALTQAVTRPRSRYNREQFTVQAKILYRSVLQRGGMRYGELSSLAISPAADLELAVEELINLGLIHLTDGWMTAVPYHHAVDAILAGQTRIIGQAVEGIREAQQRLRILIQESTWLSGDSAGTVLATSVGEEDAARYASGPRTRPRASLTAMHPGASFSHELLDNSLRRAEEDIAAGVQLRVVHQSAALSYPRFAEYLHRLEQLGSQVRLRNNLPFRLIIIDQELAVCCLQWQDGLTETLLLQGARMLGLLGHLFETIWVDSVPLGVVSKDRSVAVEGEKKGSALALTGQHEAIVRYLADGATDQMIAHSLGITTRTVTRRVNEIYQALGVQSRFQAGATARRIGLV